MKASIKLREEHQNPLLRAKVPISVLGLPFISAVSAGDPTDLSFHLRTSSPNGPSLKLSYMPNDLHSPFSLTVRSGIGLWGSPDDSPLIMSAHFTLLGRAIPSFSLQIKPQFGDFSLKKTASSPYLPNPNPNPGKENGEAHLQNGGDPPVLREWTEFQAGGVGFLSGMAVTAKTLLPVMRRAVVKFRWGVNFEGDAGRKKLPFLTMDKIGIERIEEPKTGSSDRGAGLFPSDSTGKELEVLKGLCFWMGKEVESLQRENRSMKESIEELRSGATARTTRVEVPSKKPLEVANGSSEFDGWRKKKNGGGEDRRPEAMPSTFSGAAANDVGEELKRAIKAASS
ncbi:uncharacterized protein LOC131249479 [Magnolia sinica]|uniref:uncharacterized protein LOC131249479 n=1 Tax=Magnolia sinica TaxID=86752 RepID=UPI00265AECBA|nr:uncharacterized protein LOC131249479 [Magnolia sinica]